jgi:hypothetical protein
MVISEVGGGTESYCLMDTDFFLRRYESSKEVFSIGKGEHTRGNDEMVDFFEYVV